MHDEEPWQPGDPLKEIPESIFADDRGEADALLAQALIRYSSGKAHLADVVDALAYARVLVPVVADGEERIVGKYGVEQDHVASTGVVALRTPDGRAALPVFTDVAAMAAWSKDARPIPAEGPRAALAAISEGWAVLVVNPAQEAVVIPRPAVWALGQGEPWRPVVVDGVVVPEIVSAVRESLSGAPHVVMADAVPGRSAEVAVVLSLAPGLEQSQLDETVREVQSRLAAQELIAQRVDGLELRLSQA